MSLATALRSAHLRRRVLLPLAGSAVCVCWLVPWLLIAFSRASSREELRLRQSADAGYRFPQLAGELSSEDGAALLRNAIRAVARRGFPYELLVELNAAVSCARAPSEQVAKALEANRVEEGWVREAVQRASCAWGYERRHPDLGALSLEADAATALGLGLIHGGHGRLRDRDYQGALEHYLEALALSLRLGRGGSLWMNLAGQTVATQSIQSLATLVTADGVPEGVISRTGAALTSARPALPTFADALRQIRLESVLEITAEYKGRESLALWPWAGWGRLSRQRHEVDRIGAEIAAIEAVLGLRPGHDRSARIAELGRTMAIAPSRPGELGDWTSYVLMSCGLLERADVLGAALALRTPAQPSVPPRAPEAIGRGTLSGVIGERLRVWSPGQNGIDEGGCGDDYSLEVPLASWGAPQTSTEVPSCRRLMRLELKCVRLETTSSAGPLRVRRTDGQDAATGRCALGCRASAGKVGQTGW